MMIQINRGYVCVGWCMATSTYQTLRRRHEREGKKKKKEESVNNVEEGE